MKCKRCGACCIAPSINSAIPGMPGGKPAGIRCIHLNNDMMCSIYNKRPIVCRDFTPDPDICSSDQDETILKLTQLELDTAP